MCHDALDKILESASLSAESIASTPMKHWLSPIAQDIVQMTVAMDMHVAMCAGAHRRIGSTSNCMHDFSGIIT
jgi:hypothetical protein